MTKKVFAILLVFVLFSFNKSTDDKHLHIVLRAIGHDLLVQSNDSTSRVLPLEKLDEHTFQISFEHDFSFVTDTLINAVDRILSKEEITNPYQVMVRSCKTQKVIYAYEVSSDTEFLIPCTGVVNPKDCYQVQVTFLKDESPYKAWFPLLAIPFLGFFIFLLYRKKNSTLNENVIEVDNSQHIIKIGKESIQLSDQESKLFQLLSEADGQIVKREVLLYEIWEKDGTIVSSRSLDVLVSKLRKKITEVSNFQIKNVHGKGYKLI
ncbi:winged helix-turn-helix domain-containing protein [Arcticibacterium luteifluviistationis]|uniref:OmpR/PhoB-type domain-containing protein n=1 Tax=Arcticibacterium luteifluviistationis TaxID=1784714 RepID=A0A2Z4GG75_9BACT|nr:winged helix-turn-helix domain-containing protein [Arcticibacterium luteifluviistationis]AWW00261.1 hypothetical protein DJ013_19625 [Arcticibacterium luteifluviistationis]